MCAWCGVRVRGAMCACVVSGVCVRGEWCDVRVRVVVGEWCIWCYVRVRGMIWVCVVSGVCDVM